MKALVLQEYKKFVCQEVPPPQPAADEVLVAVKACGICGSDVHGMDGSTGRRPSAHHHGPRSRRRHRQRRGGQGWKAGDRVTFDSTIYCGTCDYCRRGEINLCDNRRVLGVSCEDLPPARRVRRIRGRSAAHPLPAAGRPAL
jgi:L-iditol 2-dehydrogenase